MDKKMPDIKEAKQEEAKPAPQPPRRQQRRGGINNAETNTTDGILKRTIEATTDELTDLMRPSKKIKTETQDDSSKTASDSETNKWTGKIEETKRAASKDQGRS